MKDTTAGELAFRIVLFLVSLILVFIGQRNIGYPGLLMELIGLLGMLMVLNLYNRKFK
ncbi:MAG: hypothetical protein LKF79_05635 [Solobacterium sp.]|jgi:hypothetical protein|nr:hypothetical protein [Solobacterium sp.]MCH4221993.1 hypothetical protein [Solobacterium sp.]MCH4266106.1 hypothetical protein [Solobacterium sp.]